MCRLPLVLDDENLTALVVATARANGVRKLDLAALRAYGTVPSCKRRWRNDENGSSSCRSCAWVLPSSVTFLASASSRRAESLRTREKEI